jgi:hypothetical protein
MVDFTFTQAQTEELAPLVGQGEAHVETVVAKSPGVSPPLTADEVDRMYRQLAEIHAITTAQLADCACWCWIDSPPPHLARLKWEPVGQGPMRCHLQ